MRDYCITQETVNEDRPQASFDRKSQLVMLVNTMLQLRQERQYRINNVAEVANATGPTSAWN